MTYCVNVNGRLVHRAKACIPVFDSAFLYGEGVFETLLARNGKVIDLDQHLRRMKRSAAMVGMPLRPPQRRIRREILRTLQRSGLQDAYLRLNLSTHEGGLGRLSRREDRFPFVIFAGPYEPYPRRVYQKGARVAVVKSIRNDPLPLAAIKSTNYLSKMIGRREARHAGMHEGILLNQAGRIAEGASSSLFMVKNGRLLTPPLSEGLLPSITRKAVIELARKLRIPFREKPLTIAEVRSAPEIFIVSTLKRILPVGEFEGVRKKAPGPVTRRMMEAYG